LATPQKLIFKDSQIFEIILGILPMAEQQLLLLI
jgi:hypothetical protein